MTIEKIDLYKYFNVERKDGCDGYLNLYRHEVSPGYTEKRIRPAMLVIPGGGYTVRSDRENEPIAIAFMNKDFNAFTLEYSCSKLHPTQLIEGCMAIAYIRENAEKLHVDKDHIGAIGFSAGGHLAAMLGNMFDDKAVVDALKEKASLCRPDAVVLSYPVITSNEYRHDGSIRAICGDDEELRKQVSVENRVHKNSSPAFIWTTVSDGCVPCENTLFIASAYRKNGLLFELHMFENGVHGLSLSTKGTKPENVPVQQWFPMCITYLENHGFIFTDLQ